MFYVVNIANSNLNLIIYIVFNIIISISSLLIKTYNNNIETNNNNNNNNNNQEIDNDILLNSSKLNQLGLAINESIITTTTCQYTSIQELLKEINNSSYSSYQIIFKQHVLVGII